MKKYKFILFDLDGTLFDYDKAEVDAFERSFMHFDIDYEERFLSEYKTVNKSVWRDYELGLISQVELRTRRFELLSDAIGIKLDAAEFSRVYLKFLSEGVYLLENVEETVNYLHDKYKLFLITNGISEVQRPRLSASSINKYFEDIIISEEAGSAKPDTGIFDVCFKKMNFPEKEEVLLIGDSLSSDIAGGNNYGIDTCWFNPGGDADALDLKIDYRINSIAELKTIL